MQIAYLGPVGALEQPLDRAVGRKEARAPVDGLPFRKGEAHPVAVLGRADPSQGISSFASGVIGNVGEAADLAGQRPFHRIEKARLAEAIGAGNQRHPGTLGKFECVALAVNPKVRKLDAAQEDVAHIFASSSINASTSPSKSSSLSSTASSHPSGRA